MILTLQRITFTAESTEGEIYVDNDPAIFCYTLELPNKDGLPGSCIPQGTYPIVLAPSPKFELSNDPWVRRYAGLMPHAIQIPNRTLIMLHWGNDPSETEGCILVGLSEDNNFVSSSRAAFEKLWDLIVTPARSNDCAIRVLGGANGTFVPPDLSASDL